MIQFNDGVGVKIRIVDEKNVAKTTSKKILEDSFRHEKY